MSIGFGLLLNHAAFKLWPDLPRDMQEELFEAAVPDNPLLRYSFAVFLHDHHPRTDTRLSRLTPEVRRTDLPFQSASRCSMSEIGTFGPNSSRQSGTR
jgi:hypothetical protein